MGAKSKATVVITTKNRPDDLRRALASAVSQSPSPEVLVMDDGSTDDTPAMVRTDFPRAVLHRVEQSRGYIYQRNRAAELASGDIIFSIDDDAAFTTPHVVAQTLQEFDHPRVGAVAIPHINVNRSPDVVTQAPSRDGVFVAGMFIGTAHALRRDLFLELRGYREQLFHQGEEMDYCIRLLDAGYVTRLGNSDPIHHFESPRRDNERIFVHAARNTILYAWQNVPMPQLLSHWAGNVFNLLSYGMRRRHPSWMARGIVRGMIDIARGTSPRRPVSLATYRLSRQLVRQHTLRLEDVEPHLQPAIRIGASTNARSSPAACG